MWVMEGGLEGGGVTIILMTKEEPIDENDDVDDGTLHM
jgi:hypothetical protein